MLFPTTRIQKTIILTCAALLLAGAAPARTVPTSQKKPSTARKHASAKSAKSKQARQTWRRRQSAPDGARVREIQAALIREHYLEGQPSGTWDARTKAALERYQGENGWQTKRIPDARALIKLGLGPDHANLLNPGTAALGETAARAGSQN